MAKKLGIDDLLDIDSIPVIPDYEKRLREKERKERERKRLETEQFETKCRNKLDEFIKQTNFPSLRYPPLSRPLTSILRQVSDEKGLVSHSFGVGDEKFIMIYKTETAPELPQLYHLKQKFNPNFHIPTEKLNEDEDEERRKSTPRKKKLKPILTKKENLKDMEFIKLNVNKRDRRTVDQVQAELALLKKQKLLNNSTISTSVPPHILPSDNLDPSSPPETSNSDHHHSHYSPSSSSPTSSAYMLTRSNSAPHSHRPNNNNNNNSDITSAIDDNLLQKSSLNRPPIVAPISGSSPTTLTGSNNHTAISLTKTHNNNLEIGKVYIKPHLEEEEEEDESNDNLTTTTTTPKFIRSLDNIPSFSALLSENTQIPKPFPPFSSHNSHNININTNSASSSSTQTATQTAINIEKHPMSTPPSPPHSSVYNKNNDVNSDNNNNNNYNNNNNDKNYHKPKLNVNAESLQPINAINDLPTLMNNNDNIDNSNSVDSSSSSSQLPSLKSPPATQHPQSSGGALLPPSGEMMKSIHHDDNFEKNNNHNIPSLSTLLSSAPLSENTTLPKFNLEIHPQPHHHQPQPQHHQTLPNIIISNPNSMNSMNEQTSSLPKLIDGSNSPSLITKPNISNLIIDSISQPHHLHSHLPQSIPSIKTSFPPENVQTSHESFSTKNPNLPNLHTSLPQSLPPITSISTQQHHSHHHHNNDEVTNFPSVSSSPQLTNSLPSISFISMPVVTNTTLPSFGSNHNYQQQTYQQQQHHKQEDHFHNNDNSFTNAGAPPSLPIYNLENNQQRVASSSSLLPPISYLPNFDRYPKSS